MIDDLHLTLDKFPNGKYLLQWRAKREGQTYGEDVMISQDDLSSPEKIIQAVNVLLEQVVQTIAFVEYSEEAEEEGVLQ